MTEAVGVLPQTRAATALDTALLMDVLLIASVWCVSNLFADPIGNFPLIDDWSYGRTVEQLLETSDYRPLGWGYMTLITNVLWGSLFCLPGGFSFTALRLSTLVAALLGLIGSYLMIRDLQQPRWLALLVALALGFNPIYYSLSHTFMTDVLFMALVIWAAVFLARSLRSGSNLQMLAGTLLALAATLSRQLALFVPLAFAIATLLRSESIARGALRATTPLIVCGGAFAAFSYWLAWSGRLPVLYGEQTDLLLRALADARLFVTNLFAFAFIILFYLGLFLSPVLALSIRRVFRRYDKQTMIMIGSGIAAMMLGAALVVTQYGFSIFMPLPMPGNILLKTGVGPLALRDVHLLHLDNVPTLPPAVWFVVTAISLAGVLLLIVTFSAGAANLLSRLRRREPPSGVEAASLFLVLCGCIYLLPFLMTGFFDRYLVPALPFLAAGLAGSNLATHSHDNAKSLRFAAIALVTAFTLFSISATHDYMTWNRVRWMALQELTQGGRITAKDIDGGAEFNALYLYDPNYREDPARSHWWVHDDTYMIAFGSVPGYGVIKEYSYRHWLPPHVQKIVVLRKE